MQEEHLRSRPLGEPLRARDDAGAGSRKDLPAAKEGQQFTGAAALIIRLGRNLEAGVEGISAEETARLRLFFNDQVAQWTQQQFDHLVTLSQEEQDDSSVWLNTLPTMETPTRTIYATGTTLTPEQMPSQEAVITLLHSALVPDEVENFEYQFDAFWLWYETSKYSFVQRGIRINGVNTLSSFQWGDIVPGGLTERRVLDSLAFNQGNNPPGSMFKYPQRINTGYGGDGSSPMERSNLAKGAIIRSSAIQRT